MESDSTFLRWVELPEAMPVKFGDLPALLAKSMHAEPFARAAAEINFRAELKAMVNVGALKVRDPLTLGPHPFPIGDALNRAVLLPLEVRALLADRQIGVKLRPLGTGPDQWTLEHAADAIGEQYKWHKGARRELASQMLRDAKAGKLLVRNLQTGWAVDPAEVTGRWELVTRADVNAWFSLDPVAELHWNDERAEQMPPVTAPKVPAIAEPMRAVVANSTEPVQRLQAQDLAILTCLKDAGYDPKALPKNNPGKPGVKAETYATIGRKGMWAGRTVFKKAWERLTANGDIIIKP